VNLGFGADDRVKVARVPLLRRENEPSWLGQTKTDLREFKTTVRNLHAQPTRSSVIDRLPFSENAAIQVEELREMTRRPSSAKPTTSAEAALLALLSLFARFTRVATASSEMDTRTE
jgi:hypothetical protein